jgi:GT2 family glycosyltransferase
MAIVSIIIPHHNRIDMLKACLESLSAQSLDNCEIIVVDNGSSDGSSEILAREHPECRHARLPDNRGFAVAVNAGIQMSNSPYVIILNNDVRCERGFTAALVDGLEAHSDCPWAAPLTLQAAAPHRIDNCGLELSPAGIVRKRLAGRPRASLPPRPAIVLGASGNAAIFSRSFFETVGTFDERFFAYCEDWELSLRARQRGARCLFVPTAVCYHAESSTWGRNSDLTIFHFQRNMELAYFARWGWRFHACYLVPHLAYSLFCILRWARRGKGRLVLKAKWDAVISILKKG